MTDIIIALLKELGKALKPLLSKKLAGVVERPDFRQWIFARIAVPGLTVIIGGICYFGFGPASQLERALAIIPLSSVQTTDGSITPIEGSIVLVESLDGKISLPWALGSVPGDVRSSLSPELWRGNSSQIVLGHNELELQGPFDGPHTMSVFQFDQRPARVLAFGGDHDVAHFQVPSQSSFSAVLVTSVVAVFCFGLIAGTGRSI